MITRDEFMRLTNKKEVLTEEEEKAVFDYYDADRTIENRNAIVVKNTQLIWKIAEKYCKGNIEMDDLYEEGAIGLITAVEKFDSTKGVRFSTYACPWIRSFIRRYYLVANRSIRIPENVWEKRYQIYKVVEEYQKQHNGEVPTDAYVAEQIGVSVEEIRDAKDAFSATEVGSLDEKVSTDSGEDTEMGDLLASDALTPEDEMMGKTGREQVEKLLEELDPKEQDVIRKRYGIGREGAVSYEEIAKEMKITPQRVRMLETHAIRKIKNYVRANGLWSEMSQLRL